jgi:hypothetical protein
MNNYINQSSDKKTCYGIVFLLLILFITTSTAFTFQTSFGQEFDKEIIKANGIKAIKEYTQVSSNGKAKKEILTRYHLFDRDGNLTEKYFISEPYRKGGLSQKREYKYDSLGNLIEEVVYGSKGEKWWIYTWEYDNNGRILKYIDYFCSSKKSYIDNYICNEQGQNIEIYRLKQGEKFTITTIKYYDSGELYEKRFENKETGNVRVECFDKCGNLIYKFHNEQETIIDIKYTDSCIIDSSAYILKIDTIQYIENGKELTKITEVRTGEYWEWGKNRIKTVERIKIIDNNGNPIVNEISEYGEHGRLMSNKIYFFNEQGLLIEEKIIKATGNYKGDIFSGEEPILISERYLVILHWKFEYYDNGIKKYHHCFNGKGEKIKITEFKIVYY